MAQNRAFFTTFPLVKRAAVGRLSGLCYESRNTSEVSGVGSSLRLRQHLQDPLHPKRDFAGYLQPLPSVLHRHAEVCGHRRPRGQVPAAHGQDAGGPGRPRRQEEKEVAFLQPPPAGATRSCGRHFFTPVPCTDRCPIYDLRASGKNARPSQIINRKSEMELDLRPHIERFGRRLAEVEVSLSDPKVFDNKPRAQELSREYSRLKELAATGQSYAKALASLEENRALLQSETADSEMALMAREDVARLEK